MVQTKDTLQETKTTQTWVIFLRDERALTLSHSFENNVSLGGGSKIVHVQLN